MGLKRAIWAGFQPGSVTRPGGWQPRITDCFVTNVCRNKICLHFCPIMRPRKL